MVVKELGLGILVLMLVPVMTITATTMSMINQCMLNHHRAIILILSSTACSTAAYSPTRRTHPCLFL